MRSIGISGHIEFVSEEKRCVIIRRLRDLLEKERLNPEIVESCLSFRTNITRHISTDIYCMVNYGVFEIIDSEKGFSIRYNLELFHFIFLMLFGLFFLFTSGWLISGSIVNVPYGTVICIWSFLIMANLVLLKVRNYLLIKKAIKYRK
jgi:hypothetical protein